MNGEVYTEDMLIRCEELKQYFIFSYPRCGVTWVRYICRTMYNMSIKSAHCDDGYTHDAYGLDGMWAFDIEENKSIGQEFTKTHVVRKKDFHKRPLIFCLRNPKEAIIRHNKKKVARGDNIDIKSDLIGFIDNIRIYDEWKNRKIMIIYEDMISNPKIEIEKIGDFIDGDSQEFMDHYNKHRQRSIALYNQMPNELSYTKGKKLIYHSKELTQEEHQHWNQLMEEEDEYLYRTYLSGYE